VRPGHAVAERDIHPPHQLQTGPRANAPEAGAGGGGEAEAAATEA